MKVNALNLSKTLKSNNSFINKNKNQFKNDISKELFDNCLFAINDKKNEDNDNMNRIKNSILQGIKDNNIKVEKKNYSLNNNNKSFELSKNYKCQNFMFQSYTNRNNSNLEKRTSFKTRELKMDNIINKNKNINKFNNANKSMEIIPIKDNERNLFFKNLSHNKKIRIKNLVSIK